MPFIHKGDFDFEVVKECFIFDIKGHAKLISACCEHSCLSKQTRGTLDMRQSKTFILSTNVDKKSLVAEFKIAICRQTMAVENTVSSDF